MQDVGRSIGSEIISGEVLAACSGGPRGNEQLIFFLNFILNFVNPSFPEVASFSPNYTFISISDQYIILSLEMDLLKWNINVYQLDQSVSLMYYVVWICF